MFENWMTVGKPAEKAPDNTVQKEPVTKTVTNNDSDNDDALFNDVWNETKPKPTGDNQQQQQQNNQQQQQQQVDPAKVLSDHMKEMGMEPITLSDQDIEAFKNGENVNDVIGRLNKQIQSSYVNSMKNMDTLVNKKVEAAIAQAQTNAGSMLEGVKLKEFLEGGIPYIKDNAILGPVAETAFKKFYEKTDKNKAKALELTKRFLKETAETVNTNDPDMMKNFNTGGYSRPDKSGDQDWLTALRS